MSDNLPHVMGSTILTADGAYYDFLQPEAGGITLNAVARGLANTCRFGGQCRRYYSVAEHSVHVSFMVPAEDALWALMHDAPEAFLGDVVKPLKVRLPDYQEIEAATEPAFFAHFGLAGVMPETVKRADRAILRVEQERVMLNNDGWTWTSPWEETMGEKPRILFLGPDLAFDFFMSRAAQLGVEA